MHDFKIENILRNFLDLLFCSSYRSLKIFNFALYFKTMDNESEDGRAAPKYSCINFRDNS